MDTDLVILARNGDKEAFATLAAVRAKVPTGMLAAASGPRLVWLEIAGARGERRIARSAATGLWTAQGRVERSRPDALREDRRAPRGDLGLGHRADPGQLTGVHRVERRM